MGNKGLWVVSAYLIGGAIAFLSWWYLCRKVGSFLLRKVLERKGAETAQSAPRVAACILVYAATLGLTVIVQCSLYWQLCLALPNGA